MTRGDEVGDADERPLDARPQPAGGEGDQQVDEDREGDA